VVTAIRERAQCGSGFTARRRLSASAMPKLLFDFTDLQA